jgi:hypothetical protein
MQVTDTVKSKVVRFVKGIAVDGEGHIVDDPDLSAERIIDINDRVVDINKDIEDDIQALKSYEESGCGCGCSTAIGNPVNVTKARQKVFDSGLKVLNLHKTKVKIEVPKVILNICDELQEKVERNEFSIVCKGKWGNDGEYVISDEYYVPRQKVDGAAVDYDHIHLEELKLQGFNVVIHSHPFKSSAFSASDEETINSHFDCSILYSLREFTTATVLISNMSGVKLLATGDPHIEGDDIVPKDQVDNITKKHTVPYYGNSILYGGNFGDFRDTGRNKNKGCHNDVNNNVSARGRAAEVNSGGRGNYHYDKRTGQFLKDGVPVMDVRGQCNHQGHGPCGGNQGHVAPMVKVGERCGDPMIKVHGNMVQVHQAPRRFFTTDSPEVQSSVEVKTKKNKGGKRDNQPKIDLK